MSGVAGRLPVRFALLCVALAVGVAARPAGAQSHAKGRVRQGTGTGEVRQDPVAVIQATQPKTLPPLPAGTTLDDVRAGDALFHGRGGCAGCHGANGEGKPDEGAALTAGLHFVATDVDAIATLLRCGLMPATTRTGEGMPPRGHERNLTADELRRVAEYVWTISQVRDEPWPGGHAAHAVPEEHGEENEHGSVGGDAARGAGSGLRVRKSSAAPARGGDGDRDEHGESHGEGVAARMPVTAPTTPAGCPVGSTPRGAHGHR